MNSIPIGEGVLAGITSLASGTPDGNYVAAANPETVGSPLTLLPLTVIKFTSSGTTLWSVTLPTTSQYAQLQPNAIVSDQSGDVYVSGATGGAANGLWGIFIAKFAGDSGTLLWQKNYIAMGNGTRLTNMATDPNGNLYVTGMGNGSFI
ncbi:MAG: SBBP repeat-containing protein, partial [Acidobacteriota bacterium]